MNKLDKVTHEKNIIYNNYKDLEKAYNDLISENMSLEKKLEIAVDSINSATAFLTCMDDLSEFNSGKCNEQMALEVLNSALTTEKYFANAVKIGDFVEGKGVYAGILDGKELFAAMKDNSEKLSYETAIKLYENETSHVPSLRELTQIWLHKDAINAGLKKNGGEVLKDDWYWSSDKYKGYGYAWRVGFDSGSHEVSSKYDGYYVRPVLSLPLDIVTGRRTESDENIRKEK